MRNFASQFPATQAIAYDETKELNDIQTALASHLQFSPETTVLVDNCRKIRNKILHCDFFAAKKIAKELSPHKVSQSGNVLILKAEKTGIQNLSQTPQGKALVHWVGH